jgi:hypothetical protein
LCERYTTDELQVIRDFTERSCQMADEETRKLRQTTTTRANVKKA